MQSLHKYNLVKILYEFKGHKMNLSIFLTAIQAKLHITIVGIDLQFNYVLS